MIMIISIIDYFKGVGDIYFFFFFGGGGGEKVTELTIKMLQLSLLSSDEFVSILVTSAETVWSVTPVPDHHDRAPVSFCRNR